MEQTDVEIAQCFPSMLSLKLRKLSDKIMES